MADLNPFWQYVTGGFLARTIATGNTEPLEPEPQPWQPDVGGYLNLDSDAITVTDRTLSDDDTIWWGSRHPIPPVTPPPWHGGRIDDDDDMPPAESPFNDAFALRLREMFGTDKQSVDVPEGLEVIRECQIAGAEEGDQIRLEFRAWGPSIPKALIEQIPPEKFKLLDRLLKEAIIHAFNMIPIPTRRRTLIIEEE